MSSSEGRRLNFRIARSGEFLGLSEAISGSANELTATTLYPSRLAFISREHFLSFLMRHPDAHEVFSQQLIRELTVAFGQMRTLGLALKAPAKLARLLLEWSDDGQPVQACSRMRFALTHEQIGEFIGTSRETVSRTLSSFKSRQLVALEGSTLTIPSRQALATFAGC
jgi:CRP/FNR family transcriptional regulator, cyclic AMP receptor protein